MGQCASAELGAMFVWEVCLGGVSCVEEEDER